MEFYLWKTDSNSHPNGYDDWRHVDEVYTDALWASLMKEFDFNIEPILARPMLESRFPQFFRSEKYHLRHTIKDKQGIYLPRHIALSQCPDDIDKVWWEKFITNEYTPKKIEQRKKNAESKALAKITRTLGRKSYSRVYEELKEENPGEPAKRTTAWKRAHINKATGEVLPCAVEKYKEVEAAEKRQRLAANASGHDGVTAKCLESRIERMEDIYHSGVVGMNELAISLQKKAFSDLEHMKCTISAQIMFLAIAFTEAVQVLDDIQRSFTEHKGIVAFSAQ